MKTLKFTLTVCAAILVLQTVYMIIPSETIRLYNMVLRPLVYITLAAAVYVFAGIDERPVLKAYDANMIAVLSIGLFGIVFLVLSVLFGAGTNMMAASFPVVIRNLWEVGSIVVLGELIRYKLIKNTDKHDRAGIVLILTVVLAYGHMNALRMLFGGDVAVWAVFYESVFRPLVISAAASYFAIKGGFVSVVLVSFFYTMVIYLLPVIPNISSIVWALLISGLAFLTVVVCYSVIDGKKRAQRKRENRLAKYFDKKPVYAYVIRVGVIAVVAAFFLGIFPIYPVAILTGSMAGTFERGSLVFVERVPQGEAFIMVGEGEVIHFISRGRVEYIHRVVDFAHGADGERQYITQGDASYLIDPFPVYQDDVLGIARATLPFFGYPYIFFQAIVRAVN